MMRAALCLCLAPLAWQAQAQVRLQMWVHDGPGPESRAYTESVQAFNASQRAIQVRITKLPEGSYTDQVNAAAFARKLPCLLDFDGPNLYRYAWTARLLPLDDFAQLASARADLLPSLLRQGTYAGRLYGIGQFDSGLAIWGNRSLLVRAGVRIPTGPDDAWDRHEFEQVLARLKTIGVAVPLDMKFNYGASGEWFAYGFAPILKSMGGELIDSQGKGGAQGRINGPAALATMQMMQSWARQGWIKPGTKDDGDFVRGRAALSYVGHWTYRDYRKALGKDLILLPMPRFGKRAITGAGSWNWGISSDCPHPQQAASVLAFLMSANEIHRVTQANGAVPGTRAALAMSADYRPGGALALYVTQIEQGIAQVRPATPAYPVISGAFAEAVNNIMAGADAQTELDRAARRIDTDLADNKGYPVQ